MNRIILASKSVGRKGLFEKYFKDFIIYVSEIDENIPERSPAKLVKTLAIEKAKKVSEIFYDDFVMGFDTVVVCKGKIIGKPTTKEEAKDYLRFLSGRFQSVYSGFCIINKKLGINKAGYSKTVLKFKKISEEWINKYVEENNVTLYAGGYAIQEDDKFIRIIYGDKDVIIGAPMKKILKMKFLKNFLKDNINQLDKFCQKY